jgi:hypothetical protein
MNVEESKTTLNLEQEFSAKRKFTDDDDDDNNKQNDNNDNNDDKDDKTFNSLEEEEDKEYTFVPTCVNILGMNCDGTENLCGEETNGSSQFCHYCKKGLMC